jgi:Xaa-Pro aminopeptidase
MRNAIRAADDILRHVMREIRPGMTEWEIRRLIRSWTDRLSQGESFPCIVCAGSNASRCHHHPSERPLRRGQELLLDLGAVVDGYHSDMTRTLFCGPPSRKLREIYGIVLKANLAAVSVIRAGKKCGAVDAVARRIIEKAGYGKYFGHGLGHSVGLAIHEWPGFTADCQAILKPGMILTVEPGIYLPGVGGVRIEDMILVRRGGCEVLTRTPRTLEAMIF